MYVIGVGDPVSWSRNITLFCAFLWNLMLQVFSTSALHTAELIVNLRGEEFEWRKAAQVHIPLTTSPNKNGKGARFSSCAL